MDTTVDAPLQWVESITMLRLPEQADQRLQDWMDRNNEVLHRLKKVSRTNGTGVILSCHRERSRAPRS